MAGAVLPLSWGRASVLYSVQRFCMLSGGAPFVARLRFMFLLGFPLPHYPFLWPLPLFLFYISKVAVAELNFGRTILLLRLCV